MLKRDHLYPKAPVLGMRANSGQFMQQLVQVFFVGMTIGLQRNVLPALAEDEFGLASGSLIYFMTFIASFGFVKGAMNFVAGSLSERLGRRPVLLLGWLFAIPIPFLIYYSQSWTWIVLTNLLLGVNQGFAWSMTVTSKMDITKPDERGLATGFNEFSGYVGVAIAGILTGYLASWYDPRTTLLIFGLAIVLLALLSAYLFAAETRLWAQAEAKELSDKAGLGPDAGPRSIYADPGAQSVFAFVSYGHRTLSALSQAGLVEKFADALVWGFFPLFLAGQGLNLKEIGWIVGTYGLMWGVNQLWTGYLSDSWGRKWLIFAGMLFCAFGVAIFPRLEGVVMWSLAAAITGFGMALLYPTLIAAVGDIAPPSCRGSILGVYRFWRDTGYGIGALLIGAVADLSGAIEVSFYVVAVALVVSAGWLAIFAEETLPAKRLVRHNP